MKRCKLLSLLLALTMAVSMVATLGISAGAGKLAPTNEAYLDLEESETYDDNKSVDQKYTLTLTAGTYTDLTKVKLEWTIGDLAVTRKDAKVWNPATLTWDDDNGNDEFILDADTTSSTFKLTNLSSVPVKANAVFQVASALQETFNKVVFTNNDCTVASVVNETTKAVNTETTHEQTITATLTVNKDKFTGSAATDAVYGTYTVTISSLAAAKTEAKATVNQNAKTVLTVETTPAGVQSTDVEVPANTAGFTAGSVTTLDVETTAVAEAVVDPTFKIFNDNTENAVSAIELNVTVNGVEVHDFKDANEDPVAVTVTTYVAKGFTDVSMKYVGTGKDDPTVVSYDATTGKLVFTTTHFSTFAIGANEKAYVKETNTAYMLSDALAAWDADQTVSLLKDVPNCAAIALNKEDAGTYTLDLNGHTITFAETTEKDAMAVVLEGDDAEYVLKNGTFACTDYHYGDVFDVWSKTTLDHLTVNFTDENTLLPGETAKYYARWGALYLGAETTINECTINAAKGPGIQNGEEDNVVTINDSTVISGDHSALYCGGGSKTVVTNCTVTGERAVHACTSGAVFILNGGTYTGNTAAVQLDSTANAVDYQGVPNYVKGSYAKITAGTFNGVVKTNAYEKTGSNPTTGEAVLEIEGGTFTGNVVPYAKNGATSDIKISGGTFTGTIGTNAGVGGTSTVKVTGGTFSADPTAYVPTGYTATAVGEVYTVSENTPD